MSYIDNMQAIVTKYHAATDHSPSRIRATACNGKSCTISYDHGFSVDQNHFNAAWKLMKHMNWVAPNKRLYKGGWKRNEVLWVQVIHND